MKVAFESDRNWSTNHSIPMRTTILDLQKMKHSGQPIPVLTCYEYTAAKILDSAAVPVLLVGDSLGMVVHGYDSKLPAYLPSFWNCCRLILQRRLRRA